MIIEIIKLIAGAMNEKRPSDALDHLRRQNEAAAYAQWQALRLAYEQQEAAARQPAMPKLSKKQRGKAVPPPMPAVAAQVAEAKRTPSANAPAIARWAQPKTLRSQYLLTEILKPPLSMREPRDGHA